MGDGYRSRYFLGNLFIQSDFKYFRYPIRLFIKENQSNGFIRYRSANIAGLFCYNEKKEMVGMRFIKAEEFKRFDFRMKRIIK